MRAAYLRRPGAAAPKVEISQQHLQAAFERLRKPRWPATLEEALRDRACFPLLQGMARELARQAARRQAQGSTAGHTPSRAFAQPAPPAPRPALRGFDPKRAAANDRDD